MPVTIFPVQPVEHTGKVAKFEPFKLTKEGQLSPIVAARVSAALMTVTTVLNGRLCFGPCGHGDIVGNFDAQALETYFRYADTEVQIPHGLKRVPVGYIEVRRDKACTLYDSSPGSWNEAWLMLKCNVADALVKYLLF